MKERLRNAGAIVIMIFALGLMVLYLVLNKDGYRKYLSVGNITSGIGVNVIIDAGHGGEDGGAIGVGGIVEKDINLSISLKLKEILEMWGINVIMTRESDISVHDPSAKTLREKKTSDLHNRFALAQKTPNAVFLSIHQNMFAQTDCEGAQMFYGEKCGESKALAEILQNNFKEYLQDYNKRKEKEAGDNLYIVHNLEIPAVLIECGFISNENEAELLTDESYQYKTAFVIFKSLSEFLYSE